MKKKLILSMLLLFVLISINTVQATTIYYEATDLTDTAPGEDLWQYTYHLTDAALIYNDDIGIVFDHELYTVIVLKDPPQPNTDWFAYPIVSPVFPDQTPLDSYFVLQAKVDNPTLADLFTIEFIWLGGAEDPGSQFWAQSHFDGDKIIIDAVGITNAVPIPSTAVLLLGGMIFLTGRYRKK